MTPTGYNYYVVDIPFAVEYEVGRRGIGLVTHTFNQGDVIQAKPMDGKLMFLAVHPQDDIYYSTNIHVDPDNFSITNAPDDNSQQPIVKAKMETLVLIGLALLVAYIVANAKERQK